MVLKLRKWDSADHLKTEDDIAAYLDACLEVAGGDDAIVDKTLETLARAREMSQHAKDNDLDPAIETGALPHPDFPLALGLDSTGSRMGCDAFVLRS